jgi:hypothetical protein
LRKKRRSESRSEWNNDWPRHRRERREKVEVVVVVVQRDDPGEAGALPPVKAVPAAVAVALDPARLVQRLLLTRVRATTHADEDDPAATAGDVPIRAAVVAAAVAITVAATDANEVEGKVRDPRLDRPDQRVTRMWSVFQISGRWKLTSQAQKSQRHAVDPVNDGVGRDLRAAAAEVHPIVLGHPSVPDVTDARELLRRQVEADQLIGTREGLALRLPEAKLIIVGVATKSK